MAKLFLLSDLHLSPTHGYFWNNWRLVRDAANAQRPDYVIVSGDLCINGADNDDEVDFLARTLATLESPTVVVPGNHDVGDEPPGQDAEQIIDEARLDRWKAAFGSDRFAFDAGAWRVIGINAQLCGSGLTAESQQYDWLGQELVACVKPVALVLHKPLFHQSPDEDVVTTDSLNPQPRAKLMALLQKSQVKLVISGHLHGYRDFTCKGVRYLWVPSTAFLGAGVGGSQPMVAAMTLDLSKEEPEIEFLELPDLEPHRLTRIKEYGRYPFLRDTPACPPPPEV